MEDVFRLDGKVAVVIGGAGGLGEAIASGFITGQAIFIDGGLTAA